MASYTTTSGQTWDMIAKELFDNELKCDAIMAANYDHIGTLVFDTGTVLQIPEEIVEEASSNLPPWRR